MVSVWFGQRTIWTTAPELLLQSRSLVALAIGRNSRHKGQAGPPGAKGTCQMADAAHTLLRDGAILLGASLGLVLAFRRMGLGATLGYLVAGALVGPQVLGLVGDAEVKLGIA